MLVKFRMPTKIDIATYATVWQVKKDDGTIEFYVQTSEDATRMNWERLGSIMEEAFELSIINPGCFILDVLRQRDLHRKEKQKAMEVKVNF